MVGGGFVVVGGDELLRQAVDGLGLGEETGLV